MSRIRGGAALAGVALMVLVSACSASGDAASSGPRGGETVHPSATVQPSATVPSGAPASGEQAGTELAARVTPDDLVAALSRLETLTDEADGNRGPGSDGYLASAQWIEDQLLATGFYEVSRQEFTIQIPHPGDSQLTDATGRTINQQPLSFSPGTGPQGSGDRAIEGSLVAADDDYGCEAADWPAAVAGQIGIVERGQCSFIQKNQAAAEAGAQMLIVVNDERGGLHGTLGSMQDDFIPVTGVTASEGRRLRNEMAAGELRLSFSFAQRIESYPTFNLIAETVSGDAGNVVMAGAHLDSVAAGPGINDNGSGSAILLTTALQLAQGPEPVNKVRFAWWSGEELGLLGSAYWVNALVDTDPQQIQRLAAYLNVDMVASPNGVIGVYDGDGSDFPDEALPAGSDQVEQQLTAYFDSSGQPWVPIEIGSASDHASFVDSGVPVGGLFTGAGDAKTADEQELFGGSADQPYDPNYHQAADDFANVDQNFLAINGKASAYLIGLLARDSSAVNGGDSGNSGTPTRAPQFGYAAAV